MFDKKEYMKQYYKDNREKKLKYSKQHLEKYRQDNPLRSVWHNIKHRCYNPKDAHFKDYGARGIKVCDLWLNNYETFKEWCLENGYEKGLEIDRIDNSGDYCPSNCQFVTQAENLAIGKKRMQSNNKSGYVGVSFYKKSGKYQSKITVSKKQISLGHFTTPELALQARINAEILYFGEQKTNLK